ncbi:transcriptional regulator Spx [Psychrobacillus sp. OK032]|uniref:transcriptional regulator Spx n=1 Tax=Psychrobacillus sp. OK032 TaxID=1884358 RepID=UPI0008D3531B|nr:transcriptional regulator Spx [Psychrobacillus sp. OK032]SES31302.1 regulatory protein spx [Psychrobacillus sp. OK032]
MITLYVIPGNTSCRKARKWLQGNNIPFVERNIFSESLTMPEIKGIFRLTDNGTEDIISKHSEVIKREIGDMDQLSLKDLYNLIQKNPRILKSPIILDEKRLMVGFNEHQIRRFIPRSERLYYGASHPHY